MTKLLIDGDIVTFRAAFSAEDEEEAWIPCSRADQMIEEMLQTFGTKTQQVYLSGKNNFRYQVFPEYKVNRINAKRPKWEHEVKEYLSKQWGAEWSEGCEADDLLGINQMRGNIDTTICTIDKDLDMIPGWHYNFVKKEKYFVTPEEAIRFFYYQCLIGDTADGIKGAANIGPVKAKRILDACEAEANGGDVERHYRDAVMNMFSSYEEFLMTAQCLWIWRKPNDIWKDPYV
jgi:5'-3' exonuclease